MRVRTLLVERRERINHSVRHLVEEVVAVEQDHLHMAEEVEEEVEDRMVEVMEEEVVEGVGEVVEEVEVKVEVEVQVVLLVVAETLVVAMDIKND